MVKSFCYIDSELLFKFTSSRKNNQLFVQDNKKVSLNMDRGQIVGYEFEKSRDCNRERSAPAI